MSPIQLQHGRGRAFTLVELLAVCAVISIVIGLLLPALGAARSSGRAAVCMSNVRQLVLANDLYAGDNDQHYAAGAPGIASQNLARWHGTRTSVSEPFRATRGPLAPYLGEEPAHDLNGATAIRSCPEFAGVLNVPGAAQAGFEQGCGGYGYNNAFAGTTRRPRELWGRTVWEVETDRLGSRRVRFGHPSGTIGFSDAALAAERLIEYSFVEPAFWPDYPEARPDPSMHFRHRGLASVGWLDGHASSEAMEASAGSGVYPLDPAEFGVGWCKPADTNGLFGYE